jgi:hypothetical protein
MAPTTKPERKSRTKQSHGSDAVGYQLVGQDDANDTSDGLEGAEDPDAGRRYADGELDASRDADTEASGGYDYHARRIPQLAPGRRSDIRFRYATYGLTVLVILLLSSNLYLYLPYRFRGSGLGAGCDAPKVPQYFQTSPELWPGPTATGQPAFMAQTRMFEATATYAPNEPLQTAVPVDGWQPGNDSIFHMMGFLSPYHPSPGFGVDEYPLPPDAEIVQVQMLSRHGARYPTMGSGVFDLGKRFADAGDVFQPNGPLSFLRDWKYQLGHEILVPKGRQELFDSGTSASLDAAASRHGLTDPSCREIGVLHSYMYGKLYNPNSKIIVRTTVGLQTLASCVPIY